MTATRAREVVAAWEKVDAAAGVLGVRRENKLAEDSDHLVGQALADKNVRAELLTLLDRTDNTRLKEWLRDRLLPDIVIGRTDPDQFRAHPLVDFTADQMPIRLSLALVEVERKIRRRDVLNSLDEPGSWLAGTPVSDAADWPHDRSGLPLAHIAQIDLGLTADDGELKDVLLALGLPTTGVLQLFHDLETYGWGASDRKAEGWVLRWVQQPTRLLKRPKQLDELSYRKPQSVAPVHAISIPSSEAFTAERAVWERYDRVFAHIEDQIRTPFNLGTLEPDTRPSAWESGYVGEDPTSRIGGYGYNPLIEDLQEVLDEVLSLAAGDEYFLLFDIAGVRHLEDWFGDCGHLQVWIRRSDLTAQRFDNVWCVIRTD